MCSSGVAPASVELQCAQLKGYIFYTSKTRVNGSVSTAQNTTSGKAYLNLPKQSCWLEVRNDFPGRVKLAMVGHHLIFISL